MSTTAMTNAAPPAESFFRKLVQATMACLLLTVSICMLALVTTNSDIANRDYVEYWAAGQQPVRGGNPYAADRIFAIERSLGWRGPQPNVMFNPPSAVFLTLPLGFVGFRAGYLLWSVFILGAWLGSIHLLWIMNGRSKSALHFIGYFFGPAVACFLLGQMAALVLLGLTLFLYFRRTRPLWAGAALVLCALKPHLLLPFGIVLLAWMVSRKDYRVLAGATAALGVACLVPLFFDPAIDLQYAAMSRTSGADVKATFIPTLSQLLRVVVNAGAFWIQFLPAVAGCVWALWYFRRHRESWDWLTHGPLLILISLLVAPYSWYFDGIIVLPALFYAAYRSRPRALAVLFVLIAANGAQIIFHTQPQSAWFLLPPVAWFGWYLWSMRSSAQSLPTGADA